MGKEKKKGGREEITQAGGEEWRIKGGEWEEGGETGGLSRDGVKEERKEEEEGRRQGRAGRGRRDEGGRDGGRRSVGLEGQIMEQLISW